MTTNHHSAISSGLAATASAVNGPLGQLDSAISQVLSGGKAFTQLLIDPPSTLVISSGAITVSKAWHNIDTEGSAASDDLTTISGGVKGDLLLLNCTNNARVINVKHGTGNIYLSTAADLELDDTRQILVLICENASPQRWSEFSFIRTPANAISSNPVVNGRLTLTTATPITTDDVTGTTLYFTPVDGSDIKIYTGTEWVTRSFVEASITPSITANTNYDVFAYWTGSAVALELVAWSTATARVNALPKQNGVLVKFGDATRLYIGTVRTTAGNVLSDTARQRFVYNQYNKRQRPLIRMETADSWTVSSGTYVQANANALNQVEVVTGNIGDMIDLTLLAHVATSSITAVSIGLDGTTEAVGVIGKSIQASFNMMGVAKLNTYIPLGYHYYVWLEKVTSSAAFGYGDNGTPTFDQSGFVGNIWA